MALERPDALPAWAEDCFARISPLIYGVNESLWRLAEPSGAEHRSAGLLARVLRENGFSVRENVSGRPTAFIASYGAGRPVVGFLGEFDALPGLSQQAGVPAPAPVTEGGFGHGCGHCALGSGSLAAAIMVRRYLEEHRLAGTVRYYGCCDEEVDGVKPLMARDGEFDDVDCVFSWHPGSETGVPNSELAAMQSFQVVFTPEGEAPADATVDACELMNVAVNYLREHVSPDVRISYAHVDADAPVPVRQRGRTTLAYTVRAPRAREVREVLQRVVACAQGAGLMTDTASRIVMKSGYADRFQNHVAANILSDAARDVGAPKWDEADYALARAFLAQYGPQQRQTVREMIARKYPGESAEAVLDRPLDPLVEPFNPEVCKRSGASSDVGDVGYATPTASMRVACAALGTPAHSWFMTGMIASSIGKKGIACAAEILSVAAIRVYRQPELLDGAQAERLKKIGGTN